MPDDPNQSTDPQAEPSSTDPQTGQDDQIWGDDAPDYLKGKTKSETLEFIKQMGQGVQNLQQQYTQQLAAIQQQAARPAPAAPAPIAQPDADDIINNPEKWQAQMQQSQDARLQQYLGAVAQPVLQQGNQMARAVSQMDQKNQEIWKRWGNEVDAIVNQVPAAMVKTKALYDEAVTVVRGRHADELANERAREIADKMAAQAAASGPDRTYTAASGSVAADSDVWAKFDNPLGKKLIATMGKSGIIDACEKSGTTLEDYAEQVATTKSNPNPTKGGVWHNRQLGAKNA